jgi:hypothetical protein
MSSALMISCLCDMLQAAFMTLLLCSNLCHSVVILRIAGVSKLGTGSTIHSSTRYFVSFDCAFLTRSAYFGFVGEVV